jgi:DNA-binding HxlR family transcriptional regulator
MTNRSYGQFCGLARALELVGERWALLLVRDLLVGPRRFSDLRRGMGRIPSNVLASRLKELEAAGVVGRRLLARPEAGVVYELTDYGRGLEDAVGALSRWGARSLGVPRPGEQVTADSLVMALRTTFRPDAARGFAGSFELRVGEVVVHARVDGPALAVAAGPLPDADLALDAGPALTALMAHEITPTDALARGELRATGPLALLDRFVELFRIEPTPAHAATATHQPAERAG